MDEAKTVGAVFGVNLRAWRERVDTTQGSLARRLQAVGVNWQQSTVAAVELGHRDVSLAEAMVVSIVTGEPITTWLTAAAGVQVLSGDVSLPVTAFQAVLAGKRSQPLGTRGDLWRAADAAGADLVRRGLDSDTTLAASTWLPPEARSNDQLLRQIALDSKGEAEAKAARALEISAIEVAVIAHSLWGRSLTDRRDELIGLLDLPSDVTGRSLQARRGHVTRSLLREIEQRLTDRHNELNEALGGTLWEPKSTRADQAARSQNDRIERQAARKAAIDDTLVGTLFEGPKQTEGQG